jgi:hypothetical protein
MASPVQQRKHQHLCRSKPIFHSCQREEAACNPPKILCFILHRKLTLWAISKTCRLLNIDIRGTFTCVRAWNCRSTCFFPQSFSLVSLLSVVVPVSGHKKWPVSGHKKWPNFWSLVQSGSLPVCRSLTFSRDARVTSTTTTVRQKNYKIRSNSHSASLCL